MDNSTKIAVGVVLAAVIIAAAILIAMYSVRNVGRIKTIGLEVYSNPATHEKLSEIDWGELYPGETAQAQVYIGNIKTVNFTLAFNISNWAPASAAEYLTVTWNYANQTVRPGQVLGLTITLSVAQDIQTVENFSFDFTFIATEQI